MNRIFISEIEGKKALCFDTGLDSRSFAQSKFFQCIAEPGFIVYPSGSIETWKASGVVERDASMLVWGPPFTGGRLDALVNDGKDESLTAIACWIRSRLAFSENHAAFDFPVALIAGPGVQESTHPEGTVFFAPATLSRRCILAEGTEPDRYNCPDLEGMEAACFSAAAMLYRVLADCAPFPAADQNLYQDMREGNFIPVRLAAPGIDEKLGNLVQAALMAASGGGKKPGEAADAMLRRILEILMPTGGRAVSGASLFRTLSAEEEALLQKEKLRLLKKNTTSVQTRRFIMRNKAVLLGIAAALVIVFFAAGSVLKSRAELPTTRGLDSGAVVQSYYKAIGELDHPLMEACLAKGADKSDLDMVLNLFVISKVRQAYENISGLEEGGVFGVTDLSVELVSGGEEDDQVRYLAVYTLWIPNGGEDFRPIRRRDELALARIRGNWQITEIKRTSSSINDVQLK